MTSTEGLTRSRGASGILVDANLLVLYVVGIVNRCRIQTFKRTCKFTEDDFRLLPRLMEGYDRRYTVAHVLAEVSSLTDLSGRERTLARDYLREAISLLEEPQVHSIRATKHSCYQRLGLTDAAIATADAEHDCEVLTDDLNLYLALLGAGIRVENFSHLREQRWDL